MSDENQVKAAQRSAPVEECGIKEQAPTTPKTAAIELDMGEAGREEGFRLNGCR
jgi:hypothetical protein